MSIDAKSYLGGKSFCLWKILLDFMGEERELGPIAPSKLHKLLEKAGFGRRMETAKIARARMRDDLQRLADEFADTGVTLYLNEVSKPEVRISIPNEEDQSLKFREQFKLWKRETAKAEELRAYEDPWPYVFLKWAKETPDLSENFNGVPVIYDSMIEKGYGRLLRKTEITGWLSMKDLFMQFGDQIPGMETRFLFANILECRFTPCPEAEEDMKLIEQNAPELPEEKTLTLSKLREEADTEPKPKGRPRKPAPDRDPETARTLRLRISSLFPPSKTNRTANLFLSRREGDFLKELLKREERL